MDISFGICLRVGARCVHFLLTGRRSFTKWPETRAAVPPSLSPPSLPPLAQLEQRDDSDSQAGRVAADSQLSRSSARGANGKDRRRQMGQVCALNARRLLAGNCARGTDVRQAKDSAITTLRMQK